MRYYRYITQGDGDEPIRVTISEDQILREYFPYWIRQMIRVGRTPLITQENCIDDFCVVHWAQEQSV
jgi:hypothetical protein